MRRTAHDLHTAFLAGIDCGYSANDRRQETHVRMIQAISTMLVHNAPSTTADAAKYSDSPTDCICFLRKSSGFIEQRQEAGNAL